MSNRAEGQVDPLASDDIRPIEIDVCTDRQAADDLAVLDAGCCWPAAVNREFVWRADQHNLPISLDEGRLGQEDDRENFADRLATRPILTGKSLPV